MSALSAVLALSACAGGASSGGDDDKLTVVTSVPQSDLFMGVQAADRLGTWDDTDIEVEVIDGSSPTVGKIMASGEADIGLIDGIRAMANIREGLEASVVASCYSPWAQMIIVGKDSPYKEFADLKGANFGVSGEGSAGHYSVQKLAETQGWSDDDYKITPLGDINAITAALQSGSIDAFAWSASTAFNLEEIGEGRVLGGLEEEVGPSLFEAFAVNKSVLEDNSEAVRQFFEGYYEAVDKIQNDPQLAVDIMVEDWDVNPKAAERTVKLEIPKLSTDGTVSDEELAGIADAAEFATGNEIEDPSSYYEYWKDATS